MFLGSRTARRIVVGLAAAGMVLPLTAVALTQDAPEPEARPDVDAPSTWEQAYGPLADAERAFLDSSRRAYPELDPAASGNFLSTGHAACSRLVELGGDQHALLEEAPEQWRPLAIAATRNLCPGETQAGPAAGVLGGGAAETAGG